jgi:ribosome maturation protein Sdo1
MMSKTKKQKLKAIRRRAIANQNNSATKKSMSDAMKEVQNV